MCGRLLVGWLFGLGIGLNAQVGWDYRRADSVANMYAGHSLHDLKILTDKLTQPFSSDIDKFRALFTWTCLNIDNDYQLFLKNKYKRQKFAGHPVRLREWNKDFNQIMFTQLRLHKRTICTGYAYLIRELSKLAGLSCVMVDGYGRNGNANVGGAGDLNHTWNAVQLDGKWYLCDATWASGVINGLSGSFQQQYDDVYFLTNPELFVRNHYPLDTTWLLLSNKPTLEQFLNRPYAYKGQLRYSIDKVSPDKIQLIAKKGEAISVSLGSSFGIEAEAAELKVQSNGSETRTLQRLELQPNGFYSTNIAFKTKGIYTVHALLNSEFVLSYSVKID